MSVYIDFYAYLWYNCGQRTDAMRPLFLFYPAPRDFFVYQKKEMNMKQPGFLAKLITSPAYANKHSDEFARANKYMNLLYPGKINFDTSGNMIQPQYDMTLEQFQTAQFELDSDFENAKQEAEDAIQTEYGEYFDNLGIDFDIDNYVIQSETIAVKVLYPAGNIITRNLLIYDLNIPNFAKQPKIWRWHSEGTDGTCDECAALDETVFFEESDIPEIPVHPNCRCWVEEQELDDNNRTVFSRVYKGYKKENKTSEASNMKISDNGINMLKRFEGSVKIGDKHVIYDDKTGRPLNSDKELPAGATIGYGHLIKSDEDFKHGITERQATEILRSDISTAEHAIKDNITVPLSQNQYDALVSLAYNIGAKNFANSTVVKYVNDSNYHNTKYPTLESAWMAWNKSGGREMAGLTNRRQQEFKLFNN